MTSISDRELELWRVLFEVRAEEAEKAARRKPGSDARTFED